MKKRFGLASLLWVAPAFLLWGCGGGGGSSSVVPSGGGGDTPVAETEALVVAGKVSVVDAKSSSPSPVRALRLGKFKVVSASDLPATADYNKDVTNVYVEEKSTENFNMINEILCMIGQTKYDSMLNLGAYKAQIDTSQCSSTKSDASSAGQQSSNQSSGSSMPTYEMWTVDCSRVDNNSPEIVKAWIHEDASEYEPAKVIFAKLEITEGKTDSNPYGIFSMNFRGAPAADLTQTMFRGTLKAERDSSTGKVLLKFIENGNYGDSTESNAVTLDRASNGTTGAGSLHLSRTGGQGSKEGSFDIAYNTSKFLRRDNTHSSEICLSRDLFEESAWTYSLYNSTDGSRVARNSGFSIKKDNAYGWVGYWGLWLPQGVTINNGETVNKHDYRTNTDTPYTVLKADGKLKKHTKHSILLGDIKNIPLNWGECSGMGACVNYQVVWNGTGFDKTAQQNQSTYNWENLNPVVPFDMSTLNWGELNFWSQSLGGQVRISLNTDPAVDPHCTYDSNTFKYDCSAEGMVSNSTHVIFYAEDIVYPTDTIPATLACFDQCPNAGSSGVDTSNPFFQNDPTTPKTYTFDTTSMLLKYGDYAVVQNAEISGNSFGIMTGAMFEPSADNMALLKCDWDANMTCGWKAWSVLDVFYTWETGLNDWNKFTVLKDSSNAVVKFDPPLQVEYTHSQTDSSAPDYKYNGTKFYLEYSGFGNLQGIPGKCVNMDTGLETDCKDSGPDSGIQWVAAFTIPNGATATEGADTYFIKALEKSQRMRQDPAGCSELSSSLTSYTLPTIAEWVDPGIGDEPTLTSAPAVIGGVVQ